MAFTFTSDLKMHIDLRRLASLPEPFRRARGRVLKDNRYRVSPPKFSFWKEDFKCSPGALLVLRKRSKQIYREALAGIERARPIGALRVVYAATTAADINSGLGLPV